MSVWSAKNLFSSKKQDWETPQRLFDELNSEFEFTLDAAATDENAKCSQYLTEKDNALTTNWHKLSKSIWLNPPYGREIRHWVKKAYIESLQPNTQVVVLTFARTDTKWWHDWAMRAAEIRLIPGRVKFGKSQNSAPAPSCVLVFNEGKRLPRFTVQKLPRQ